MGPGVQKIIITFKVNMGDLYPIIEGPVKFRDGKKVSFYLKYKEILLFILFLLVLIYVYIHCNFLLFLVEITICQRDEAIPSSK